MKNSRKIFGLLGTEYNKKRIMHDFLFLLVALVTALSLFGVRHDIKRETVTYKEDELVWQSQYIKQFDALLKGQLHLDVEPSLGLLELDNPYDPVARNEAGVDYLWDHALYEGKYYCYFGAAPLLTTYLPVYAVKGELPNDALASLILGIYAVIFLALAYREVVLRFAKRVNLWLYLLGFCAVAGVSGIYYGVYIGDIYNIPLLSAIGCSMAFVFFAFRAMRANGTAARCVLLVFAAISLGLTVMSRPSFALMCIAVFPIFIEFLVKSKKEDLKKTLGALVSFIVPLAICAAAVMWYNAARFSSPFDFGEKYQLTVSDVSQNTFEVNFIFSSFYSYFLNPFWYSKETPYFIMSFNQTLPPDSRYVYGEYYVGAFAFVLPALAMLYTRYARADRALGKRDITRDAFALLTALFAFIVAYLDFCKGGTNMRYVFDIIPMLSLLGAVAAMGTCSRAKGWKKVLGTSLCALAFCAALASGNILIQNLKPIV
jgi:hypothetical protein